MVSHKILARTHLEARQMPCLRGVISASHCLYGSSDVRGFSCRTDLEAISVVFGNSAGKVGSATSVPARSPFFEPRAVASVPRTVPEIADSLLLKVRSDRNRSTVRGTLATARGSKNGDHPHRAIPGTTLRQIPVPRAASGSERPTDSA